MPWRLALAADGHRVITRTYTGYQHTTIWWSWLEDEQKDKMVIWWLPQYWLIILSTFYQLMILAWRSPVTTNRYQINQSIKNSRWSSDDCLSIDILTSYDKLIFMLEYQQWQHMVLRYLKTKQKNIFWTYGHQMMMIRRSAKTADEHQIIAGILIYFHHTINLWSWLEDQQWQYMVIRCSQELKQIINTRPPDD